MPVGTLIGYALMMQPPLAEHTYVESSHGHVWPCWGRSMSGRQICVGGGNTAEADCLSQPNSQAGIVYGITGVCHQTANRASFIPLGRRCPGLLATELPFSRGAHMDETSELFSTTPLPPSHGQNSIIAVFIIHIPKVED